MVFANQLRMLDIGFFVEYARLLDSGHTKAAEAVRRRFRPETKAALDAWLATRPIQNPDAPTSPFTMPEYTLAADQQVNRFSQEAERLYKESKAADANGQRYGVLTVLGAAALFFIGLQTKYTSVWTMRVLLGISLLILLITVIAVIRLPVAS